MSILSGFKALKKYIKKSTGYQLVSQWTHPSTVEFDDGDNLTDKYGTTSISSIGDGTLTGSISMLYEHLNTNSSSRFLTVGANGANFTSINAAITQALSLSPTKTNPVTIFIYPGTYTEQIVLNDYHGISFIGCGTDKTLIQYNGQYPDCVIHAQGDYLFCNMTIQSLNSATYAVHIDPVNTTVEGKVAFEHCNIMGGISSIGYGSGKNTELYVKDCILSGSQNILYAHNCAYNRSGQKLTILNNLFLHTSETNVLLLDDAGYSNGGTTSVIIVTFSGNTYSTTGYGKVQFRKDTSLSTSYTYLPHGDSNIKVGLCNANNSGMPGLNYVEGYGQMSIYAVVPSTVDGSGAYQFTIQLPIYASIYTITLNSAIVPGVGDVKSNFSISGKSLYGVNLSTTASSMTGRGILFTLTYSVK